MHGLAVMLRWDFLLHGTCLFKTLRILILFSNGFTSVGDFFVHLLYLSGWFLILFHLTLVKFLSSNLSANIFVFGDFHFTQIVNFFCLDAWLWLSHSCSFGFFFVLTLVFCFTVIFPPLVNSDHIVDLFLNHFLSSSRRGAPFYCTAYGCSQTDWDDLQDHLRNVSWEDIFNLGLSPAAAESCECPGFNWCMYCTS